MTLDEVLRTVAAHVPYLRAETGTDGDGWVRGDVLVADTETLATVVGATKAGFETDDDEVAASLFAESYAFRVAGVPLVAYALDLPVPDSAPAVTAVRLDKPRPSAVAYLSPEIHSATAESLTRDLVDAHLAPFVDRVHDGFRVGERLLWGNVAAACAVAFRAVESSGADRARVRARALEFFAACGSRFAGLGRFTTVDIGEGDGARHGWYWDRTSCCLWFRTESGALCDNCSLIDPVELRERRVRELRSV